MKFEGKKAELPKYYCTILKLLFLIGLEPPRFQKIVQIKTFFKFLSEFGTFFFF